MRQLKKSNDIEWSTYMSYLTFGFKCYMALLVSYYSYILYITMMVWN